MICIRKVSDLQAYLKERGVVVSGQRRLELAELCQIAKEIHLEVDPDGLLEDRADVIAEKLCDGEIQLQNPALMSGSKD